MVPTNGKLCEGALELSKKGKKGFGRGSQKQARTLIHTRCLKGLQQQGQAAKEN